ncbi:MAG: DUF1018 domain-containing protein [Deltaproteobacteria bacterium]|nr:DUF1018 domain-containing protein [Deltaproteobacteria bacterium]
MIKRKKATDIYKTQNTLIHKAMHAAGYPYAENKSLWLNLMNEIRAQGNDINGLSDMTLGERAKLLAHFQKKGQRIFAPSVPEKVRDWKKGDPDIEYEFREEDNRQVAMVFAMWAEMGYRRKTLYGLCFKMFGKDHPRWLDDRQLSHLVNVVKKKAESKGCGVYYRRTEHGKWN